MGSCMMMHQTPWVQRRMVLVVIFSNFPKLLFFCCVVATRDIVHDVKTIHGLYSLLLNSILEHSLKYE